jgi:hypothetical protein
MKKNKNVKRVIPVFNHFPAYIIFPPQWYITCCDIYQTWIFYI